MRGQANAWEMLVPPMRACVSAWFHRHHCVCQPAWRTVNETCVFWVHIRTSLVPPDLLAPHMPRSCRARLSIHNARRRKRDPQGGGDGDMMGDAAPPPWMLTATKRVGPVITVDLEQHHAGGGGGGGQVSLRLMWHRGRKKGRRGFPPPKLVPAPYLCHYPCSPAR